MEKKMSDSNTTLIIITGPESVGKTSLVTHLSKEPDRIALPEFARDYIGGLNRQYNYNDIETIARRQVSELAQARKEASSQTIFLDTYLIITKIWFLWHAGRYPEWLDPEIAKTSDALYLLCSPDIEWQEDNVRENGGEARERLFDEYKRELEKFKLNYKIVKGIGEERFQKAISYVNEYIRFN
jgi:nicotinamide riboside kinase